MRIKKWFMIIGFFSPLVWAEVSIAPKITVYSTHNYQITSSELAENIYFLDAVEHWEDKVSRNFSANPQQAISQANQFFASQDWVNSKAQLKQAYEGVISGWQNGIKKVPAILFQHPGIADSVIYGETNVAKALGQWRKWYEQQK